MTKKLSSYAAKRRQGLVPYQYGTSWRGFPHISDDEAERYEREAYLRTIDRNGWRRPLVRVVRHQGIIDGERHLLPLTAEEARMLHQSYVREQRHDD